MKLKLTWLLTLFMAFVMQFSFAQEKTVTGTVTTKSDGLPLPGASVIVKGTSKGAQTDFDGKYAIQAKSGDVLEISYVGMKPTQITVGGASTYNAALEDANTLDEVIVTAYGIKRSKRETVYTTQALDKEELVTVQPQSVSSSLAGKVAGLQINVQDNGVNPSTQLILRGLRSISQSNGPLIVIDNAISTQGAFDQLNPNDVESINVLKGATAAALYGSRAGNGAVLITTKKGTKNQKFTFGINSSYNEQSVSFLPEFQDEYGSGWQGAYEAIENTNWGPALDGSIRRIGPVFSDGSFNTTPYSAVENQFEDFYNTGASTNNTLYMSGGDETSTFYASIGKLNTTGILPSDEYSRETFRANASKKIGDITLSVNSSYATDNTSVVGNSIGSQDRNIYWFLLNAPINTPLSSLSDWENNFYASPNGYPNGYYENPYWAIDNNRDNDRSRRMTGNVAAEWDVSSWLNVTGRLGVNNLSRIGKEYRNEAAYSTADQVVDVSRPSPSTSFVEDYESQSSQYTFDLLAVSDFTLTEDISLKAILGSSNYTSKFRSSTLTANNLSIPGFYDISNTTQPLVGSVNESQKRTYGVYTDLTFGYKNFLFLNFSGRNDWTSTLREEDRSYFYPGFGLSFLFSDLIEFDALNYGKFTINNSTVYNDLGAYEINETYSQQLGFPYGSTSTNGYVYTGTAVDENIKKEKIGTLEFGLDLSFFNNRVTLNSSYFTTKTSDLITFATTPDSAGGTSYLTNIGEVSSNGIELTLGLNVIKANEPGDFEWDVNANYFSTKQEVVEIGGGLTEVQIGGYAANGIWAIEGEEYPVLKTTSYERDDQGRVIIDAASGNPIEGGLKNLGKTTPDYIVGLTNKFAYKGFTLTATFDYRTGHVYYSQLADRMEFTGRSTHSVSANRQDFIFPNSVYNTGTDANPVYVANTNIQVTDGNQNFWTNTYNNIKENYVYDATAVKLRELSLNYQVPSKFLDKTAISKVNLSVYARNVFTWLPAENKFSDPEFNGFAGTGTGTTNTIGIGGYDQNPPTRTLGVNLNIEF